MDARTAKKQAKDAALELYYDTQWQSWGLVDPQMAVESLWISPAHLRSLDRDTFQQHYIEVMIQRIREKMDV